MVQLIKKYEKGSHISNYSNLHIFTDNLDVNIGLLYYIDELICT